MAMGTATSWPATGRRRDGTALPVLVAGLAIVVYLTCVTIAASDPRAGIGLDECVWFAGWLACAVCGAAVARSARGRRYGWFLIGIGVCAETEGVLGLVLHLASGHDWPPSLLITLSLVKSVVDVPPQTLLLTMGLLLFPTGRLWAGSRRWRWFSRTTVAATAVLVLTQLVNPGKLDDTQLDNPFGVGALKRAVPVIELLAFLALVAGLAAGVATMVARFRRGEATDRRAVGVVICAASWVLLSVLVEIVLAVAHETTPGLVGSCIEAVTIAALPAAALTTTVRRTMFDVDLALNRNLTYLALTVIVIGGYALTVTVLGRLFEHRSAFGISLLVTGLIAVLFGPLKLSVQQGVEYVLLGRRATPYRALATLGRRLDADLSPSDALTAAVRSVAETFRLPHVALTVDLDGEAVVVAEYGDRSTLRFDYPLQHRGQLRGTLHLAPRTAFESLTAADERLLADFNTRIAGAVEAVQLTEQLRHSRTAVVLANEEERRRIRRELHDGIGPVLASTALAVQRVERQLDTSDPRRSTLTESRVDVQHAIDDIRRIVHGLRPAALDELGLTAAITQRAAALSDTVSFDVRIADGLPALPAAVEVVAYRVATEAMTNVVRHARATACTVTATADPRELVLRISDNGAGMAPGRADGIGIRSMSERVQELGGRLTLDSSAAGTEVTAWLPR